MSFNQVKNKRVRASSARPSNDKVRPLSGNAGKPNNKIEFIENLYGGLMTSKRGSNKNMPSKFGINFGEENEIGKLGYSKIFKQKQQLLQQNMQLKKQINILKQQLSLQKGRTEAMRKKTNEFTKKLGIQFQKQMYWSGSNANMVRGIKSQYETMKEKYQEKCLEFDQMTKEFVLAKTRQDRTYINMLQNDNQKLMKRLSQSYDELRLLQHGTLTSAVEESLEINKKLKSQLVQQNANLVEELNHCKQRLNILSKNLQERQNKIAFLDRLLIEKDNAEHGARRKQKSLQKQKQILQDQFTSYKRQKQDLLLLSERKIQRNKQLYEKQSETERTIFKQQLQDKSARINKLQKEIAYLTTLLSYWKPLDQINEIVNNNLYRRPDDDKDVILEYSMNSTIMKHNASKHVPLPPFKQEQEYDTKSIIQKSRKGSADNTYKNVSDVMTKSIDLTQKISEKKKPRIQITADKRNSEEGVKTRKVHMRDVADICQTLKYRFIGFGVGIQQIKKYFNYNQMIEMVSNQEQQNWKKIYLTARQVKLILQNQIFNLNQNDSQILSRYLVEDSPNDHVYADPNNQNMRTVIKSIIKNIIGDYDIPANMNDIIVQGKDLLGKYETNLKSALHMTAPKGIISKKKLVELFEEVGIQLSKQLQNYFLGRVVIKSENLNNLKYEYLFKE